MGQISLPVAVSIEEIKRKRSLGAAISLCADVAGLEAKQVREGLRVDGKAVDKAQWSRWESGQEGIVWPKLAALMDLCGNDAPLIWMLWQRGYDVEALRKTETDLQRQLREANEANAVLVRALAERARG